MSSWNKSYLTQTDKPMIGDTKISAVKLPASLDHTGWLLCDGRTLTIREYGKLYNAIGNVYGGDGTTTFALPNPAGSVPGIIGNGRAAGPTIGSETHTLIVREMPAHVHTGTVDACGNHTHTYQDSTYKTEEVGALIRNITTSDGEGTSNTGVAGSHVHTFTTESTGGGQPHNNMQPTTFVGSMYMYAGRPAFIQTTRKRK